MNDWKAYASVIIVLMIFLILLGQVNFNNYGNIINSNATNTNTSTIDNYTPPALPTNETCVKSSLPSSYQAKIYQNKQTGCIVATLGIDSDNTSINSSVNIFIWITNLYQNFKLNALGGFYININNSAGQLVYGWFWVAPCATPCDSTAMSIYPGIYGPQNVQWNVRTDPFLNVSVQSGSTYYISLHLRFIFYPSLIIYTEPIPIHVT